VRIPKPFEVGALFSTLPQRLTRLVGGLDSGKAFAGHIRNMLFETFALDPTPQIFKPGIEMYANRNAFTGRKIVPMGLERNSPGMQYNAYTSPTMVTLAGAAGASPLKMQHLWRGYTGTLGSYLLASIDLVAHEMLGNSTPTTPWQDYPVIYRFVRSEPAKNSRWLTEFYELRELADRVRADIRKKEDEGNISGAREIARSNARLMNILTSGAGSASPINSMSDQLSDWRALEKQIYTDPELSPAQKRRKLDQITAARNRLLRREVPSLLKYVEKLPQSYPAQ